MLVVVPLHELANPLPGGEQGCKRVLRIAGAILHCFKKGFRIRVVVADRRATERGHHAQRLQRGQHRRPFHRTAIVRVQHHLMGCDVLPLANIAHDLGGQLAALGFVDLPADDLAAKNIHEQIQVKILAPDPRGQVRNVPTEQLVGRHRTQRARLAALVRGPFSATVPELIVRFQNTIECGFRGQV